MLSSESPKDLQSSLLEEKKIQALERKIKIYELEGTLRALEHMDTFRKGSNIEPQRKVQRQQLPKGSISIEETLFPIVIVAAIIIVIILIILGMKSIIEKPHWGVSPFSSYETSRVWAKSLTELFFGK